MLHYGLAYTDNVQIRCSSSGDDNNDSGVQTIERVKISTKTKEPKRYRVLLLNDDYTTMDFVVEILETVFNKTPAEAVSIMLEVHRAGRGLCGVYTKQIAEAKVDLVHRRAAARGHPLRSTMEENV